MKKTLLIAAAALAASVISSQAQVYSQNIVGYINTPLAPTFNLLSAPMQSSPTNSAEDLMGSALQGGDVLFIWNGGGYTTYQFEGTGNWVDQNFNPVNVPLIPAGTGFYYQNNSGSEETNTCVGTVVLTNLVSLAPTFNFIASTPPIATVADSTNMLGNVLQGGDVLFLWNGGGFTTYQFEGIGNWVDQNFNPTTDPVLPVGQGFIYQNNSGSEEVWTNNFTIQ